MSSNFRSFVALSIFFSAHCLRDNQVRGFPEQVELHAYWVRHGLSCANALKQQSIDRRMSLDVKISSRAKFLSYSDPPLTDCAIDRAQVTGPKLIAQIKKDHPGWVDRKLPILVFSSQMLRAIETALYNFHGMPVYPIPHIAEMGFSLDNIPKKWNISRALKIGDPEEVLGHITFIKDVNDAYMATLTEYFSKSDYEAFKRRFPDILRNVLERNGVDFADIDSSLAIPLVIVSHSGFMAKTLACQKDKRKRQKPANNQAWMQIYHVTGDVMEDAGCNEDVLAPGEYGEAPKAMCANMVQRCRQGFKPTKLFDADEEQCKTGVSCSDR